MSVILPQIPARLRRMLGRFVGPAGAALFSLVLASCAGGGFGGAPDAPAVNPASQPAPAASGPISPASQRNVAEALSGLKLGDETPPISPEDIAVSDDAEILNRNPFSSSAPAARASGWGARADSTRKTQGYKAFEVAVPSENPLMTVAVWISETPPDYPEGKPEQDPEADRKFLYLRLQVFIEVGHVALVEGGGIEVLDSEVIVVEEKRPDPKPKPVTPEAVTAETVCESGSLSANGQTRAQLNAGLISAAKANDLPGACEYLRRGANVDAREVNQRFRRTALMIAASDGRLELAKLLHGNGGDVRLQGGNHRGGRSDSPGWSALHYSAAAGHADVVSWLLDEGADMDGIWGNGNKSVMMEAAYWGRPDVIEILLSRGANVNALWGDGATPLHAALNPYGPNIGPHNIPSDFVMASYDVPNEDSFARVVSLLASHVSDVNARTHRGWTALDYAAYMSKTRLAEILRGYGGRCSTQTGPLCGVVEVATPDPVTLEAVTAETVCESGSLSANGQTQAQLDAGLLSAAEDNDLAGACEYLRRGANVDARESDYKRTALMIAANDGFLDLAKLLHANGSDVNLHGGSHDGGLYARGWSALMYAAVAGNVEIARLLLDAGAEIESVWDGGGKTALWEASYWGRPGVVELLLSRGADVLGGIPGDLSGIRAAVRETTVNYPYTRTMLSYYYPKPSADSLLLVVSLLAAGGAELNERRRGGRSILDEAVNRNNARVAKVLRQFGGKCFLATGPLCGVPEVVTAETVCESGSLSANGLTQAELDAGLISAARDNDLEGACEYLRRGANVEAQESEWRYYKRTALMIAATDGHLDLAKLLRANGADVNRQGGNYHNDWDSPPPTSGNRRMSALHYASGAGHKDFVEWLLAEGADLSAQQTGKRDALWEAAFWGRVDIVKLFLSLGADVNARDVAGATPFLDAVHHSTYWARYGNQGWGVSDGYAQPLDSDWATVISLLVSHGTDVNARYRYNHAGYSALDIAVSRGNAGSAEVLRGYGVRCFVQTGPLCGEVHVAVGFSSSGSGTVSAEGGGDALSDGDEVRQGATVMFTATPAAGHYVSGWSGSCADAGEVADGLDGAAKFCAAAADSDLSVRAEFSEIPSLAGPLCPSGSLSTNGLTQAQLDAGLISAAKANNLTNACEYLRRGANIETVYTPALRSGDAIKRTPLVIAAANGRLELSRLLLNNGANVNWQSGRTLPESVYDGNAGWSALALAAAAGRGDVVGLLLDRGANVDVQWDFGRTALHEAAIFGRASVVELLLARGAAVDVRDLNGETALHGAAWGASPGGHHTHVSRSTWEAKWDKALDLLLDAGAEVNLRSTRTSDWGPAGRVFVNEGWNGGWTPLDRAVAANKRSRALKLRARGGFCNVQSGPLCPTLPVTVAVTTAVTTVASTVVTAETVCESGSLSANGLTQAQLDAGLISAAKANNLANACEYLRRGASPDSRETRGYYRTALIVAADRNYPEMAGLLLSNGADADEGGARSWGDWAVRDWAALHYATSRGYAEVVRVLLEGGADADIRESRDRRPLFEAAFHGRLDIAELLLSHGAELDARDRWNTTALLGAVSMGSYGEYSPGTSPQAMVVSLLISRGANVNARTNVSGGESALDVAARHFRTTSRPHGGDAERYAEILRNHGGRCFVETGPLCGIPDVAVEYAVIPADESGGTVSAKGDDGALSHEDEVRQGTTLTFTATPASGWMLSAWGGDAADCSGLVCALAANSDLSVHAEFSPILSLTDLSCPAGTLPTNGLTAAELNMTLRMAARGGDATRVCEALRRGAEVNDNLDDSEFTPLQEAVSGGHLEAAKVLLANGAEVNKRKGGAGHSPLDLAARDGEAEIAALLRNANGRCFVETGPLCQSVPVATPDPVTVVNTVAATVASTVVATVANTVVAEVENTVASTVAAGSCPAGTLDANGMTQAQLDAGLLDAVWESEGETETICEYLRRGANVDALEITARSHPGSPNRRLTGLMMAAIRGWPEVARLLLDNGADPDRHSGGDASQGGLQGVDQLALNYAAAWGHVEIVRLLLDHGANINMVDAHGRGGLFEASFWGRWDIVNLLLERGANPQIQDKWGWSALHGAAHNRRTRLACASHSVCPVASASANPSWTKVVSVLLSADVDVNARLTSAPRYSPLDEAVRRNHADFAAMLRAAGGQCFVSTSSLCGSAPAPAAAAAESAPATDRLRESFAGAFNPSPAFGDAFGATSGSSQRFLSRLDSLMRSTSGSGGNAWDSFAGWQRENEHGRMWFSTGQRGDFGFGAGVGGAGGDLSASPFAAMVGNGMLAGGETGLGAAGKLRIAAFADYQARSLLDGTDRQWTKWAASGTAIETAMTEAERFSGLAENQTRGAMTEIHLGGGDLGVALQAGAVSESDAMLSGTADDENLRGLRARTAFAGLSGAADLFGSGWRLRGSAHLGRSWAESERMLRDGDLWASAFSAGLERGGWLYSDDGFILRFSQPLRVESLEMDLIGADGASRLGADPSGRQLDVDAAYRLPLSGGGWLLLSAGVRRDGGHTSSSDLEAGALFSVERGF